MNQFRLSINFEGIDSFQIHVIWCNSNGSKEINAAMYDMFYKAIGVLNPREKIDLHDKTTQQTSKKVLCWLILVG